MTKQYVKETSTWYLKGFVSGVHCFMENVVEYGFDVDKMNLDLNVDCQVAISRDWKSVSGKKSAINKARVGFVNGWNMMKAAHTKNHE